MFKKLKISLLTRYISVFMVLSACAREGFPPGGPEDRTPPQLVEAAPAKNATRVPLSTHLEFTFSEKIDHASFEQALFISPAPVQNEDKKLRFRWRGLRVEVGFPDSLRPERTYVVTLGTDVRDLRNNRLASAFSLAFSTGDSIDTGEIHGKIFHEKPAGILILAYLLDAGSDTARAEPNPAHDRAEYFTQAGTQGDFVLPYLSDGRYRIFALEDRSGDRLYNLGEEAIGVPPRNIVLSPSQRSIHDLNFRLATEDTLRPTLSAVTAVDQTRLELRFDERVMPGDSLWQGKLRVASATGESLQVLGTAPHPLDLQQVHVLTQPQQAVSFKIFLEQILDAAGNTLDSLSRQMEFTGSAKPDTTRPRLVKITPADSSRNVPVTSTVEMIFSEMMENGFALINNIPKKTATAAWPLQVQNASGKPVPGKGEWLNPFQFRFQPDTLWQSRTQYVVTILADSTFDASGNALFDTTGKITFWTLNADTLTAISGKITDAQPDATGTVHLTLRQVGASASGASASPRAPSSSSGPAYNAVLAELGAYRFEHILPGLYQLGGFRDANRNGRYDFGAAFPFLPAERFVVWPDTIKTRSRWPNEGNDFVLP
ncbi:Ig-like domain-containing protein [candidate division KSB1 bacterium]|nr:Ig-like domain-containing protein [candidate division KSB1 bacterium]